jgi:hypothetical protein
VITVAKETDPPASMQPFSFTGDLSGVIHDGQTLSGSGLPPGTFSVSETPVSGWTIDTITCDDGDSTGDLGTGTATFEVGIGESVTCTFVNRQDVGTCGYPVDVVVGDHTVDSTASWHACHGIRATDAFVVSPTGDVTLRAGSVVMLDNGFSVQNGGRLTIDLDPSLQ